MNNQDDLQPDLEPVIELLRANRPEATALELDAVKQRVRTRVAKPARRRTRRAELMKSRLAILMMLVLGMLLSTTGAGLAITGLSGNGDASVAAYPGTTPNTPTAPSGGGVLGDQDTGSDVLPEEQGSSPSGGGNAPESAVQPSRQVEAGAGNELPFTGFAAIPILLGGLALLSMGLVLRRRTSDQRD
jgi:hypothetical protein